MTSYIGWWNPIIGRLDCPQYEKIANLLYKKSDIIPKLELLIEQANKIEIDFL